jgi:hypothetical protein
VDADVSCTRSRVMQWVVLGTVSVFLATGCWGGDSEESAPTPYATSTVDRIDVEPGSFGTEYWRLFESELHPRFGFETVAADNGTRYGGSKWFRLSGRLEGTRRGGQIDIYVWRLPSPTFLHSPYVRRHEPPMENLADQSNDLLIIARDNSGTRIRFEVSGDITVTSRTSDQFVKAVQDVVCPSGYEKTNAGGRCLDARL